ncbi:ATP synthase F1 subunit gamma [Buchnera aphidicola (Kurisakia onigurumii)]|uniref:ATP synthase F1 subunit gamma n=1 Tax=Buchnera aphidicola TaxID=9 RepID=UPI0031B69C80
MSFNSILKNKIISIQNTRKITKAMEMISISKMRKTQNKMLLGKPYYMVLKQVIKNSMQANLEYIHPYLKKKKINSIGIIIVSTDKGLCGGLNINIFKKTMDKISYFEKKNYNIKLIIIGSKAKKFFQHYKYEKINITTEIGENPSFKKIISSVKPIIDLYEKNKIKKIFISFNKFTNRLVQKPKIIQLLPFSYEKIFLKKKKNTSWDYIYEPNSKFILNTLFNKYLEFQIYQIILENLASEQSARMISMHCATENSDKLINNLKLQFNKSRQSSITQELSEIISSSTE